MKATDGYWWQNCRNKLPKIIYLRREIQYIICVLFFIHVLEHLNKFASPLCIVLLWMPYPGIFWVFPLNSICSSCRNKIVEKYISKTTRFEGKNYSKPYLKHISLYSEKKKTVDGANFSSEIMFLSLYSGSFLSYLLLF